MKWLAYLCWFIVWFLIFSFIVNPLMHSEMDSFAYTVIAVVNVGIGAFGFRLIYQYYKKSNPAIKSTPPIAAHRKIETPKTPSQIKLIDTDDAFYAKALDEVSNGQQEQGLWAKSLVEADGDKDKATARYIKQRVAKLSESNFSEGVASETSENRATNKYIAPKLPNANDYLYPYLLYGVGAVVLVLSWSYFHKNSLEEQPLNLEAAPVVESMLAEVQVTKSAPQDLAPVAEVKSSPPQEFYEKNIEGQWQRIEKDGATILTISNLTPSGFHFRISGYQKQDYNGEIDGDALILGGIAEAHIQAAPNEYCNISMKRDAVIHVTESNCLFFHGMAFQFEGSYGRG